MAGIIKVNQYQDFNGNTLFTSDGNGNLTTQEIMYPAFQANMSGNSSNQTISNTTETVLNFVTEEFDTDNAYDTTNKRFNPQVSGKYYIYASARWADTADWDASYIKIRKNGSTQILAIWWRNEFVEGNYIGAMVDMNGSSDYVDIVVYQGSGSNKSIEDDLGNNIFGGYRIGS
tara:strand:- start:29 stop:550 length:522 start_codon:yes stop_codon:yes gene_type:complete